MITDHAHRPVRPLGRFAQRACGICGEPNDRHLSYGEQLADRLGGDPLDYVTGAPTDLPGPTGADRYTSLTGDAQ